MFQEGISNIFLEKCKIFLIVLILLFPRTFFVQWKLPIGSQKPETEGCCLGELSARKLWEKWYEMFRSSSLNRWKYGGIITLAFFINSYVWSCSVFCPCISYYALLKLWAIGHLCSCVSHSLYTLVFTLFKFWGPIPVGWKNVSFGLLIGTKTLHTVH